MTIKDDTIIKVLQEVEIENTNVDSIKMIMYSVAVGIANENKKDNPRFNSGDFLMKLL